VFLQINTLLIFRILSLTITAFTLFNFSDEQQVCIYLYAEQSFNILNSVAFTLNPFFVMKQFVLIWLLAISVAGCKKDLLHQADASSNNDFRESGVFSYSLHEFTGIAVSVAGRTFSKCPLWNRPHKYDVVEITSPTQHPT
jgi:hypothetical protein